MEKMKVMVLGVQPYSFKNDNGEEVSGLNVWFTPGSQNDDYGIGHVPKKVNVSLDMLSQFKNETFPRIYDAQLGHIFTGKGIKTTIQSFAKTNVHVDLDKLFT